MPLFFRAFVLLLLTFFLTQTAHASTYGALQWNLQAIHVQQAWHYSQGAGAMICNIDTGADLTNPDIAPAVAGGTNTVAAGAVSFNDDEGHGTHTAGLEIGRGVNITGVAPQAKLLVVKALKANGTGSDTAVTAGIFWCATHGAQVINMSLGGGAVPYDGFKAAIHFACSKNVAIAVASGNDAGSIATDPASVHSPCLVAVNAADRSGKLASFSNFHENPRSLDAPGQNIASDYLNRGVGEASGTSMAAPQVTGTLALLRAMGVSAVGAVAIVLLTAVHTKYYYHYNDGFGLLNAGAATKLAYTEGYR